MVYILDEFVVSSINKTKKGGNRFIFNFGFAAVDRIDI